IGAAIADELARLGCRLTLMGRDRKRLESKAATIPGAAIATVDVASGAAVTDAFAAARAAHGPISILINNAGVAEAAPLAKLDEAMWNRTIGIDLTGVFLCAKTALPDMTKARWGRIVTVASTAGLRGYAYITAYAAAKHGAVGFTRALALEVIRTGVTVNAVCPGYVETDMVAESIRNIVAKTGRSEDEARAELVKNNPMGRLVQPEEVAAAVGFLCLPSSGSVTGQALSISGGEVM
ncbi:MAG: SDR family oxidoreductase, partial [Alphaproteobacteria bacterium]|nr:SDR family oxidoreductase [Alphaproteobacteria bacterium]